eukprot:1912245-Alexandrium_andersonii.AAC.1
MWKSLYGWAALAQLCLPADLRTQQCVFLAKPVSAQSAVDNERRENSGEALVVHVHSPMHD